MDDLRAVGGLGPPTALDTHFADFPNQPPAYENHDLLGEDAALHGAVSALLEPVDVASVTRLARALGSAEHFEQARLANATPPRLAAGAIEFHPAYQALTARSVGEGLHAYGDGQPYAAYARAARLHLTAQVDCGHLAPFVTTHAAPRALAQEPELALDWLPLLHTREYETGGPPADGKRPAFVGFAFAEEQGGSDLRSNATRADPADGGWVVTGSKCAVSTPHADAFFVTAQTRLGPTCFLVPRDRPDGSRNAIEIVRLKEMSGLRSGAVAELNFDGALGRSVGDEGRGIATVFGMLDSTRLDSATISAGLMRAGLARAVHYARYRRVFGATLSDQAAMRSVLADLALEVEGATAIVMRLALAVDRSGRDAGEAALVRFGASATKYLLCKVAPAVIAEAMECLGGEGCSEASGMPRLYRDAPANALWEGPGSLLALDTRRTTRDDLDTARELLAALADVARGLPGVAAAASAVIADISDPDGESRARRSAELLGRLIAVAALAELAPRPVTEAYARLRLAGRHYATYGASGAPLPEALLIERAMRAS
jgi:putative acyl-CoA dehydrogenase